MMKAKFINPFITAATEVLSRECGVTVERDGSIALITEKITPMEITAMIGVTGSLKGIALYCMERETALAFFSAMLGEPANQFDDLARSAIGELGNMITGRAAVLLAEAGYGCQLTPPTILEGKGATIMMPDVPSLAVPMRTGKGAFQINVGLTEG